ncbi:unnamed protein product [Heligmosomoides polygyrus]|uniref:DUF2188 domain-containing protein n=1 Tax=Heligmosomoides polygyrus TaxID=6339 RepID=A0A183GVZ1_HELPZ|nr:unnamed protein product [Heligmosomoides polygyrus]
MEMTQRHGTLAFSGQPSELEEQAKWARIDTLDAHVLMAIARKKLEREKGADHVFVRHRYGTVEIKQGRANRR